MKILGIDYGDYKIGLSIYDTDVDFIYPLDTLTRKKSNILRKTINRIVELIYEHNIKKIIIGYPLNMDNSEGIRVDKTKTFVHMLKNKLQPNDLDIVYVDERLTSFEAENILMNNQSKNKKLLVDQVASMCILNDYREMLLKNE